MKTTHMWILSLFLAMIGFLVIYPKHIENLNREAAEENLEAHDLTYQNGEKVSPSEHIRRQGFEKF